MFNQILKKIILVVLKLTFSNHWYPDDAHMEPIVGVFWSVGRNQNPQGRRFHDTRAPVNRIVFVCFCFRLPIHANLAMQENRQILFIICDERSMSKPNACVNLRKTAGNQNRKQIKRTKKLKDQIIIKCKAMISKRAEVPYGSLKFSESYKLWANRNVH